ncbi:MAG TPA: hypothetical protein VGK73_18735 [Polyangiaceae bacterium]
MSLPEPESRRSVREIPLTIPTEDDEPTKPLAAIPPSGVVIKKSSLTVRHLSKAEAGQLALIIAAWEGAESKDRNLLAEFAKRLAANQRLTSQLTRLIDEE